jgi:hypothetical protein
MDSVKKSLGFESEYTAFDLDVVICINAAFGSLWQLGVGPNGGFMIGDNTVLWSDYVSDQSLLGMVQSYLYLRTRMVFDTPERFGIEAFEKIIDELGWRINVEYEALYPPSDPFATVEPTVDPFQGGMLSGFFAPKVINVGYDSTVTLDAASGNIFQLTLTADCTIADPANATSGEHITLELKSNGFNVTWGDAWNFGSAGQPSLSSGGKLDIISAVYRSDMTSWLSGFTPGF